MELIEILKTRQEKNGKWKRWAKFKCPFCLKIVEKRLCNGLICKSCGCKKGELIKNYQKGRIVSLITRIKMSTSQKGKIVSEETKQKMKDNHADFSLEKGPNWQGGISFEIYLKEFKLIKKLILERDNYTCQFPDCTEIHDRLHVHHIDYDKKNNNPENLIILGTSCHSKTNGKKNRKYWIEFYQNIILNKLVGCSL